MPRDDDLSADNHALIAAVEHAVDGLTPPVEEARQQDLAAKTDRT